MKNFVSLFLIGLWPALMLAQPSLSVQPKDSLRTYQLETVTVSNEAIDGVVKGTQSQLTTDNVEHFLKKLYGVDLINRGVYAAEPVYRGMSGERVPVTINNMKIFGACTDKMDPVNSYVSANNLKSIKVVKDAGSAESMNSTSGVIAFKTKMPVFSNQPKWSGQLGGGYRSVNAEYNGQFSTSYSAANWAIRSNGTYRKAENYVAGGGKEVLFSQYEKTNLAVSASSLLNEHTILNAGYIFDLAQNVGYPALPMDVSTARGNIYSVSMNNYVGNNQFEVKLYGSNILHVMDDSQRTVIMRMDMPGWSNTYGAILNWTKELEKNTWSTSLDYYINQSRAEMTMFPEGEIPMYMLTWPDVLKNSITIAFSNKRMLAENTSLALSAKIELGSNKIKDEFGVKQLQAIGILGVTGNEFVLPSVSTEFVQHISLNLDWNIMAAFGQRQGSVSEGFGYYLFNSQDNYDYIGDPRLATETTYRLETGLSGSGKKTDWSMQVFGYHIPNYIIGVIKEGYSPMTIGASGVKFYINLPYAQMVGFEGGLGYKLNKVLNFNTQVQYTYGVDSNDEPLPLLPPLKNTTQIDFNNSKWSVGVELRSALAQNNPRVGFGETATPGYSIFNLDVGYKFLISNTALQLSVQAKNLLDQYYWDHLDFNNIPSPGRSLNFSILLSWE